MLAVHLMIYTLVMNCSETSGSVDKQRAWLKSFLPSVFSVPAFLNNQDTVLEEMSEETLC